MRRYSAGLIHAFRADHMNNLNNRNSRQSIFEVAMCAGSQVIADLDAVSPARTVLCDDVAGVLSRGQQERSDWRRNGPRNLCDLLIADYSRTARHIRNQTQRRGATFNGQRRFLNGADAADFYSRSGGRFHVLLFAVGYPDVLDLSRVLEKPASLGQFGIEPVDRAAFVGEDLF